jgi:Ca-activated chloride channel family protein
MSLMNPGSPAARWTLVLSALLAAWPLGAQTRADDRPDVTRVLFLLDASGSMADDWRGRPKFAVARELLAQAMDSVMADGKAVEFGLRVFGHQSPRALKDCEDSKLEVSFARQNGARMRGVLDRVTPQGWTPIAYSLFLAAHDFPRDPRAVNVVVLISDGLENCDGDPCAAAEALRNQRVALRPYIIGLGLTAEERAAFDCVGTYYDAAEPEAFRQALGVVISQALRNTTVQLNLLDQFGRATETDVEVTFYDAYSRQALEQYVHTTLRGGLPDTLWLDPAGRYDVVAHTTPPVAKRQVELTPGQHNVIALDVPQGNLDLVLEGNAGFSDVKALVRDPGTGEILYVQSFNTRHRYLAGRYDLELLTLPREWRRDYAILPGQDNALRLPAPGRLIVQANEPGVLAVFVPRGQRLELVHEWPAFDGRDAVDLQPGQYVLVFRPSRNAKIDRSRQQSCTVYSTKTSTVKFE